MEKTTLIPPPSLPVAVDVHSWLRATEKFGFVPMTGIFRHAEALCRLYWPCYSLSIGEMDFSHLTVELLQKYLGKTIVRFAPIAAQAEALGIRYWVSLSIDFTPPWIGQPMPFRKVALVHDTLALEGHFGGINQHLAQLGLVHNDWFAYVSVNTLHNFNRHLQRAKRTQPFELIQYGGFHTWKSPVLPDVIERHSDVAVTIGSADKRKRLADANHRLRNLGARHFHIGTAPELSTSEKLALTLNQNYVFLGALSEEDMSRVLYRATFFACMSEAEGFSMPPLEAVLHGVPHILLSDIPVHREIYGEIAATFCSGQGVSVVYRVTEADRLWMFERFKFERVSKELREMLV